MTNRTEKHVADLKKVYRSSVDKRCSGILNLWNGMKPVVVPFMLGTMLILGYIDTAFAQDQLYSVGPGGGGACPAVSINPQDPDNIFLGCDMMSNFISQNGGQSFNSANFWAVPLTWYFNPHDENIAYTSTPDALYITKDKGKTWDFLYPSKEDFVGIAQSPTSSIAAPRFKKTSLGELWGIYVHPADRNILYSVHVSSGAIYRSIDAGKSWTVWKWMPAHNLRFDESGGLSIGAYAQMMIVGNELRMITRYGLYRFNATTGANISWTYKNADGQTATANGIALFKNKSGTMLMKNGQLTVFMSQLVKPAPAAGTRSYTRRILKSTDFGATWTCITDGFIDKLVSPQGRKPRWNGNADFVFVGASGNKVYTGFRRGDWSQGGVAVTEDDGNTWTWALDFPHRNSGEPQYAPFTSLGPIDVREYPGFGFSGTTPHNMAVNPSDPNHVVVTNMVDVWQTRDGGVTWAGLASRRTDNNAKPAPLNKTTAYWTTTGIEPAGQDVFVVNPFNQNHHLSGWTDCGMYESFDGGKSWRMQDQHGYSNTFAIAFDPHHEGVVLAGHTKQRNTFRAWTNPLNPAVTENDGLIARSTNGGKAWTTTTHVAANNLLSDPVSNGLPSKTIPCGIVFCPIHPNVVYVALRGAGVYKSTDCGINWVRWSDGIDWQYRDTLQGLRMTRLVLGKDNKTLFVLLADINTGTSRATGQASAYKLDLQSQASTWVEVNRPNGLQGSALTSLNVDTKGTLYAGAYVQLRSSNAVPFNGSTQADTYRGGAYVSTNDGVTWRQIYDDTVESRVFVDSYDNSRLYLTTRTGLVLVSHKGSATTLADWIPIEGTDKIFYGWTQVWEDPFDPNRIYVASSCGGTWSMPVVSSSAPVNNEPSAAVEERELATVKIFQIERGDASSLITMLESLFSKGDDVSIRFAVDNQTNSIVATGLPEDISIVEGLLKRFTRE